MKTPEPPSNMGTDKQMEEIVVAGSEEDSGANPCGDQYWILIQYMIGK